MVLYISTNHKYVGTLHLFLFFPCCVVTTLCSWSGWVQAQKTLRSGQHVLVYWDWWPPGMLLWWRKYQCPSNGQNMDMTQLSNFLIKLISFLIHRFLPGSLHQNLITKCCPIKIIRWFTLTNVETPSCQLGSHVASSHTCNLNVTRHEWILI